MQLGILIVHFSDSDIPWSEIFRYYKCIQFIKHGKIEFVFYIITKMFQATKQAQTSHSY